MQNQRITSSHQQVPCGLAAGYSRGLGIKRQLYHLQTVLGSVQTRRDSPRYSSPHGLSLLGIPVDVYSDKTAAMSAVPGDLGFQGGHIIALGAVEYLADQIDRGKGGEELELGRAEVAHLHTVAGQSEQKELIAAGAAARRWLLDLRDILLQEVVHWYHAHHLALCPSISSLARARQHLLLLSGPSEVKSRRLQNSGRTHRPRHPA